jgi:glycosyltransferase involved in cell wall biosynthesis
MLFSGGEGLAHRVAIAGIRGIPANYGGFETFAQELACRLAARGHEVTVYGRSHYIAPGLDSYKGVKIRRLPAIRHKYLDTVSHTALSMVDTLFRSYDVVLICNAANAFLSWLPRLKGQRVVLNVDGIERLRRKWNSLGKAFYRLSEWLALHLPNEIVTDARTIQGYYQERYGRSSRYIPYGATVGRVNSRDILEKLGLEPEHYFLFVSRLEPENNAHLVVDAYLRSGAEYPLALVGDAPYSKVYIDKLRRAASAGNVLMPGAIYGVAYKELLSHSLCYFHGTEVGGSHPALIEAMGAGAIVIANDNPENREVLGDGGILCPFSDIQALAGIIREVAGDRAGYQKYVPIAQQRVAKRYDWDRITTQYEELFDEFTR